MVKEIIQTGRLALVLNGKYAGRKAMIVRAYTSGTTQRPYAHAIVTGVDRYPKKITRKMNRAKVFKRSKVKPFVKAINLNHLFFTRFKVDMKLNKSMFTEDNLQNKRKRRALKAHLKEMMEKKYLLF